MLNTIEETAVLETKYLTGLPLHLLGLALMASIFMIALDLSIISMWHASMLPSKV